MTHFQNLKLKQHKGLKTTEMLDLGKINVLCGPNNSGKTTALECIADVRLRSMGITLDADAVSRMQTDSVHRYEWPSTHMARVYPETVAKVATKRVWFADEAMTFFTDLSNLWQKTFPNNSPAPRDAIIQAFRVEFALEPAAILIPAKRRLETTKVIDAHDPIQPDGTGILNFLFSSKNQEEQDPARKQFEAIGSAFREISAGYEFDVYIEPRDTGRTPSPTSIGLKFRRAGDSWIQAADCGLGLHDLIIIVYFALASEYDVVLIEEPENHLHPEIQRRLIKFLREGTEKQFFLSTHSSVFLNTQFADRIFSCKMANGVQVSNSTSRAALLTELGYSIADNLVSDLIVLSEGPKDKPFLDEFFEKYGLGRYNIKV